MDDFLFVDLAKHIPETDIEDDDTLTDGKPFVGFVSGAFVDMLGREVEFEDSAIASYLANTRKAIEANLARRWPGLPIDARKHEKGEAAGWIVGVEETTVTDSAGVVRKAINVLTKWTKLGVSLVKDKIFTSFSPSINNGRQMISGGSLTNYPAMQDANGVPLAGTVELSQGIMALQVSVAIDEEIDMNKDELREFLLAEFPALGKPPESDEPKPATVDLSSIDLSGTQEEVQAELAEFLREQHLEAHRTAQKEAKRLIELERRNAGIADFAQQITGGTEENPRGLPVEPDQLQEFLQRLEPGEYEFATGLFKKIQKDGLTDFSELGHSKTGTRKQAVPDFAVSSLRRALKDGATVEEFFAAAGLGSAADYDLSAYQTEEKE